MKLLALQLTGFLLVTCSLSLNAQGNESGIVSPLSTLTTVEENIQQLTPSPSYETLRFGPYGRVFPGRWEIGVYFTPWVSFDEQWISLYQKVNDLEFSPAYNYPGTDESILGVLTDVETVSLTKRPGIAYLHVDVARQFHAGWRLGLGYTLTQQPRPRKLNVADLPANLTPNEYAFVVESRLKGVHLNAHFSYTFNRNKRFRPAIGINAVHQMYYGQKTDISFYDGATRELTELDRISPQNSRPLTDLFFLAQVSLQYQLKQHFSIGLETAIPISPNIFLDVPLISVGGRYAFAKGW